MPCRAVPCRAAPFGQPPKAPTKSNYARRVHCQTSPDLPLLFPLLFSLPSPAGWSAAARSAEVTGDALLTYSLPPSAYLLLPSQAPAPTSSPPSLPALSQRPRPPPTDARQARRPARRDSGPSCSPAAPPLYWPGGGSGGSTRN